jgi:hypothetical protein
MKLVVPTLLAMKILRATALILFATVLGFRGVGAQTSVQLALSGVPVSFDAPTAADLTVGTLEAPTPLSFQVATTAEPAGSFTTTVSIRASSATLGGGKPAADLEWRRGDDPTWHALTTSDAIVESRVADGIPEGHTWDNTIYFRIALHWTSDPPATYTGNLVFTVSTTQP